MFCHIRTKDFHLKAIYIKTGVCIESRFMIFFAVKMTFAAKHTVIK